MGKIRIKMDANQQLTGMETWLSRVLPVMLATRQLIGLIMKLRVAFNRSRNSVGYSLVMVLGNMSHRLNTNRLRWKDPLGMVLFALRFLDWFRKEKVHLSNRSIPPAPCKYVLPTHPSASNISEGRCGVCRKPMTQDLACLSTGRVFCRLCILNHVKIHGTCPITKSSVSLKDVRILRN